MEIRKLFVAEEKELHIFDKGNELIEQKTIDQAMETLSLEGVRGLALMPDAHVGMGACIGSVIYTKDIVIPAAVGSDIGCGVLAVKLDLQKHEIPAEKYQDIYAKIKNSIPTGFLAKKNKQPNKDNAGVDIWKRTPQRIRDVWAEELEDKYKKICGKNAKIKNGYALEQLGTLGGGNHFIELCLDQSDIFWILIHSGSRGAGSKIGSFFTKKAKKMPWNKNLVNKDLSFLYIDSEEGRGYLSAARWAQKYAELNRKLIAENVLKCLGFNVESDIEFETISCHHNFIEQYSKGWLTRKGAISARENQLGLIPGSMGDTSYIVKGLGNIKSFHSSSHGAGRLMSRTQAKNEISTECHENSLSGIVCDNSVTTLDETPTAYKDIDRVMEAQKELTMPINSLTQVLCVKG